MLGLNKNFPETTQNQNFVNKYFWITNFFFTFQIITLPLCRLIALVLLFDFDRVIKNCKVNPKNDKSQ